MFCVHFYSWTILVLFYNCKQNPPQTWTGNGNFFFLIVRSICNVLYNSYGPGEAASPRGTQGAVTISSKDWGLWDWKCLTEDVQVNLPALSNFSHLGHSFNGLGAKSGLSSGLPQGLRLSFGFDHPQDHHGPFRPCVVHWAQGRKLSASASVTSRTGQRQGKNWDDEKSEYSSCHIGISVGRKHRCVRQNSFIMQSHLLSSRYLKTPWDNRSQSLGDMLQRMFYGSRKISLDFMIMTSLFQQVIQSVWPGELKIQNPRVEKDAWLAHATCETTIQEIISLAPILWATYFKKHPLFKHSA